MFLLLQHSLACLNFILTDAVAETLMHIDGDTQQMMILSKICCIWKEMKQQPVLN